MERKKERKKDHVRWEEKLKKKTLSGADEEDKSIKLGKRKFF